MIVPGMGIKQFSISGVVSRYTVITRNIGLLKFVLHHLPLILFLKTFMITPPALRRGDRIGIVAPARKISEEELRPSLEIIRDWGLEPVTGKHVYGSCNQFSGTDEERARDLQSMLDDDSVKAVLCARGGYGMLRIIDRLDFSCFYKNPKWLAGYSDVTVLHSHVHHNFGIETIHSTMPVNFMKSPATVETLRKALFGEKLSYSFSSHPMSREGEARGIFTGGNLSLLYALSGSRSDISTEGKVLFIEDIDEYLYHLDRMMLNMKRSGKLSKLAGLVVGGMTDMKDNTIPYGRTAEAIIMDAVREYSYPVGLGFPAGHIDNNFALVMGGEVSLSVGSRPQLRFL